MKTPLFTLALLAALSCTPPFPSGVTTPDEVAEEVTACPCPDLAGRSLNWFPEDDPDAPGPCSVKSRTKVWMPAEQHPACQRETRLRAAGVWP